VFLVASGSTIIALAAGTVWWFVLVSIAVSYAVLPLMSARKLWQYWTWRWCLRHP